MESINRVRVNERERETERPLVPQRDRLSHGLSEGSLRGELQLLAVYRQSDNRENIRGESRRRRGKGEENKKEEESATLPVAALNCLPSPPPDRIYCPSSSFLFIIITIILFIIQTSLPHHHAGLAAEPYFLSAADARGR